MQDFVMQLLQEKLPASYYYHNHLHTLYVVENAEKIGKREGVSAEEMQLLQAAALWHDTGYINVYSGHEYESCILARQYLPDYNFTQEQVEKICGMIMATMVPQDPHNKLEEILADADLAYLGTPEAPMIAAQLFLELQSLQPSLTEAEWNRNQLSFLRGHHFFTDYCQDHHEPKKQEYIRALQKEADKKK